MNSDKFKRQIESMWKHRDTDEQKRLVKFTIAKTMRLALEYPELAQEYYDSLCKVIPDNERITVSNYQHNLTSKAEGEELLTCEKYKVEEALNYCDELDSISGSHNMLNWGKQMIVYLFGSKCLLDEDVHEDNFTSIGPKPAEPKFKVNDVVRTVFNETTHITSVLENGNYYLYGMGNEYPEDSLTLVEPYTEPTDFGKEVNFPTKKQSRNLSQNCDKQFDNILKDGFRNERRLNIAAMAMQGILSCDLCQNPDTLAKSALLYADALIAECEKKGGEE